MAGSTDNIAGIILAAGTGSRMGGHTKQLLPFKGRPLLTHAVEKGLAAGLSPLILVLGHGADRIKRQLDAYPVDIIVTPDFTRGMAASLKAGLHRLDSTGTARGALFLLGDQPLVRAETLLTLREAARNHPGSILIPVFKGRRGNPVYFDACFFPELRQVSGDMGGRVLIGRHPHAVREIAVDDPGIGMDIDTPEDYEDLLAGEDKDETH
ncbi:MAG: nucleotidyltransferase family protein [Desulfobacter sp.]|nr:MAG: nucleotidyltransferase family protein [Desulfobacter sp.]